MLVKDLWFSFDYFSKEVRVHFLSKRYEGMMCGDGLEEFAGHHDGASCPPTLNNLLVVRELLDVAIQEAIEKEIQNG